MVSHSKLLIANLQKVSKRSAIAVFWIGFIVIIGWCFDIGFLKSVLPGLVTMKANTAFCFHTYSVQNQVAIVNEDNGLGISETSIEKLFDPFFTTKPVGKGTGLGLAISYQIITEKHQGELTCFSQPGKGAKFEITLPLVVEKLHSSKPLG